MSPYISFSELPSTQKGDIGEHLVDGIIASTGAQLFRSLSTDTSHYLDRFYISHSGATFAADAKAKVARSAYPDSGIDLRFYQTYTRISQNSHIPFIIYFVDEFINSVYGNYLSILIEPRRVWLTWKPGCVNYPIVDRNSKFPMVYFPLENMVKYGNIDEETSAKLKQLSNRNYKYPEYRYPEWLY